MTTAKSETVNAAQNFKYDHKKVREHFAHMVLIHEFSFNFVEYKMFNLFMRMVSPNQEKINRATSRKDCFSNYEVQKKQIKFLVDSVNRVNITVDIWTSNQKIQYMVVIGHFVDLDLRLQKMYF